MTKTEVIIRKSSNEFYGAEIYVDGALIGAAAITDVLVEEFGERTVCYQLRRKIGNTDHVLVNIYDAKIHLIGDADIPIFRKGCD